MSKYIDPHTGVFQYEILGKAIKNSDVIEIIIHEDNPRQQDARMFLLGADMCLYKRSNVWKAHVSHAVLERFQREFKTAGC